MKQCNFQYNISGPKTSSEDSDPDVFYDDILSNHDWSAEKLELEREAVKSRTGSVKSADVNSGSSSDGTNHTGSSLREVSIASTVEGDLSNFHLFVYTVKRTLDENSIFV